jgi:kynurenine formamidase
MEIIDLSVPIVPSPPETPDLLRTEIEFSDHVAGVKAINDMFAVGPELLRDGEGWADETFTRLGTHNSTHIDAPYHYNSTIRGEPAQTIDQLPLEWFFAPGVVLAVRAARAKDSAPTRGAAMAFVMGLPRYSRALRRRFSTPTAPGASLCSGTNGIAGWMR